jgi:hypothetical protein
MCNAIAFGSSRVLLVLLVASLTAIAGCDHPVPPSPSRLTAGVSLREPADNARQRDDPARNRVWLLNLHGVFVYTTTTGKLVEVPLPSWQWVDAPDSCPPDLALGPEGEVVVTSNVVPVLWRIDPNTLAVSMHELALDADNNKDVGFSRLVYSSEHNTYFAVSDVHGSLWQIDRSLREGRKIDRVDMARGACCDAQPRGTE